MIKFIYILLLFPMVMSLSAQQVHRETKVMTKEYAYKSGGTIDIAGERLFLKVESWTGASVEAQLEVISEHTSKEQAKADLEKIKIVFDKKGKNILFSNALRISSPDDKPLSKLKTKLVLKVPVGIKLNIRNNFGENYLSGVIKEVKIVSKFCANKLDDFDGKVMLESEYDDLQILNSLLDMDISGNRSEFNIVNSKGRIEGDIAYGALSVDYANQGAFFNLEVEHTPTTLIVPENYLDRLEVICQNCSVKVNNCNSISDEQFSGKKHKVTIGKINDKNDSKNMIRSKLHDVTVISVASQTSTN